MKLFMVASMGWLVLAGIAMAAGRRGSTESESIPQDPLTVVTRLTAALNEKKIDAALPLFADPIHWEAILDSRPADHRMVRAWLASRAAAYDRAEISDLWLEGDTVTWVVREDRASAVTYSKSCAQIQRGQIKSLKSVRLILWSGEGEDRIPRAGDSLMSCDRADVALVREAK